MTELAGIDPGLDAEIDPAIYYGLPRLAALIDEIGRGAIDRDERDELPYAPIEEIKRARVGALRLPVSQGGGGATLVEAFKLFIDLGAADSNVAHIVRSHFGVVENLLLSSRPEASRWLERVARGELIGSASTEPSSKAGAIDLPYKTTVTQTADGLRLNGTKHYTTGSLYMDWLIVGVTDVDGGQAEVIIPTDRAGIRLDNDWDGFGQRYTGSGTVTFDDVVIGDGDYFTKGRNHRDVLPYRSTFFHIQLSAMIAGILRRVARDAVDHVQHKARPFYHAVSDIPAEDPIVQYSVGLLHSQAFAAESIVLAAGAALSEAYDAHGTEAEPALSLRASLLNAQAKVVIDDIANRAASELFDVGGGSLVRRSAHLDRHWRNIRTIAAHNPKTLKAVAVGRYAINGTPLPNQGFF
ncbi:acyl-CoA dehydrogenase family protein [Gordonia rubripertincta]|uniref:acyl-CoA dehydrogenase family protein n=1 Tax=Gordonia rubripertincta TaxID=36822 RepID=UPI000B8D6960|nr:acyl-CoA dehydrogenase family protein [Gordonia rubripertincta]ASR01702.1 Dibenzothiophene desulfurization enzyme C [Gordonia rubripertincta]